MKISDLLRKAADMMDQQEAEPAKSVELAPVDTDNTDNTDTATMISPLQQKHELLKKVSDVANDSEKFDDPATDDGSIEQAPDPDDIAILKHLTGLTTEDETATTAAHFIADDHESD